MALPKDIRLKVLFVCSENIHRSPTAEALFSTKPELAVESAGLLPSSRHPLTEKDLDWADVVLVMEDWHRDDIAKRWPDWWSERGKDLSVLGIPDRFSSVGDERLVKMLEIKAGPIIESALFYKWGMALLKPNLKKALQILELAEKESTDKVVLLGLVQGGNAEMKERLLQWLLDRGLVSQNYEGHTNKVLITQLGRDVLETARTIEEAIRDLPVDVRGDQLSR